MKYKIAGMILLGMLMQSMTSCTKNFLEYNTNPDEVTDDLLDGDNYRVGAFFPQMQMSVIPTHPHQFQVSQNLAGDVYAGYMAGIGEWNQGKNGTTYQFIDTWLDIPFKDVFVSVIGADQNVRKETGADISNPVVAFSSILKIASLHRLTDLYGPLPYSKIAAGGSLNIEYDSQELLYKQFLSELTQAIETLSNYVAQNPNARPMADYDLVYNGDYVKWIRFANSLKLRMAMRCVYVDPKLAQENAEEAVNHPFGVITTNADNASLKSGKGIVIKNPIQTMWDTYSDCRMGAVIQAYLTGYNDPRLPVYFNQVTINDVTGYFGSRTGVAVTNKTKYKDFSSPNASFEDPLVWMTAAECFFLKAEGAMRKWNMGVTDAQAYETGIKLSFEEKGVSGADRYIEDATSKPGSYVNLVFPAHGQKAPSEITIKWDDKAVAEVKLERIITQKWIALYPNGAEAWSEYRRTGYPKQFPVIDNFSNGTIDSKLGIRRIPFPPSEYRLNGDNVSKAVTLLGGPDNGGTKLWWDKK
ncbi:RagB/SusD family nutrient uptake outer membrane protein [Bacteroides sp.]